MPHSFEILDEATNRSEFERLLRLYMAWVIPIFAKENGLCIDVEIASEAAIGKLGQFKPPDGVAVLGATPGGSGIGFVQRIRPDAGEVKRLFVEPGTRGSGLGRAILKRLCTEAEDLDMARLYLDTASFMHEAHGLYRSEGFVDCDHYPEAEHNPVDSPTVLFMCKELG